MIHYVTGNLLEAEAIALVNTVNCEGVMGKGIAYQFKLAYPETNKSYISACENGSLRVGTLHYYRENGKIVINFPTKIKWRNKSEMDYIEKGLDALIPLLEELSVDSVAIPPLGSGNGGLVWGEVRELIEKKLNPISEKLDIYIYEPSKNYIPKPVAEPKLSASALVLMQIKLKLNQFSRIRLQKTAFIMDLYANSNYFKFSRYTYGPFAHSIDIVSKSIKEFQTFYNLKDTATAYDIALKTLISESVQRKLDDLEPAIYKATDFVNRIETNKRLECITTILYLLHESGAMSREEIIQQYKAWSEDKSRRFTKEDICAEIDYLYEEDMIVMTLDGFLINPSISCQ
ncbi:macro domain-containing protein [Bengtsoniella intestinalis]|uniref:type II toxin-antitoxin system antitoxin DNA ADP-ribosyl glycohydrolase DarG n=1 Tax=Bengtsoniella intestinalis TaxID=3073143 RepID=UPI00391F7152